MDLWGSNGVAGHSNLLLDVRFSPDGGLLASSGADGRVIVWDVDLALVVRSISLPAQLGLGGADSMAEVLHFPTEEEVWSLAPFARMSVSTRRILEYRENIAGRQVSPDGRMLLGGWGTTLRAFDLETGGVKWSVTLGEHVCGVCVHPDGKRILVSTAVGIEVRSSENGQVIGELAGGWEHGLEGRLTASGDGRLVAVERGPTPTDRTLEVRLADDGSACWSLPMGAGCLQFSPDGTVLATGDDRGVLRFIRAADGAMLEEQEIGDGRRIACLAFSPDGRILAAGTTDGVVRLLDIATGRRLPDLGRESVAVRYVIFGEDGSRVFTARDDGRVACRRIGDARNEWEWREAEGATTGLDLAAGGLLLMSDGHQIHRVAADLGLSMSSPLKSSKRLATLSASPDARFLATSYERGGASVREARTGKLCWRWRCPEGDDAVIGRIVVSSRGHVLVIAGRYTGVLDVETGETLLQIPGEWRDCQACFSRDGRIAAVSDWLGTIEVFQTSDWSRVCETGPKGDGTTALSLSPDGRLWACGTAYASSAWIGPTDREGGLVRLMGHTNAVVSSAFSPDGRFLVTGSYDGSVRLWAVPSGRPLEEWQAG